MKLVCKVYTLAEIKEYLAGLDMDWARFVVVHNTSVPNLALYRQWLTRPNWTPEVWLRNLGSYYSGLGWNGAPHFFIPPTPDQILVLNDPRFRGTHSPSWNRVSLGIETVGEFQNEPFDGGSQSNLVALLAMLHKQMGWRPEDYEMGVKGVHFHREDKHSTHKTCPGRNLVKSELVNDVLELMDDAVVSDHAHVHVPEVTQEAETAALTMDELTSIRWMQERLNDNSAKLVIDGRVGPRTVAAVRAYQSSHNLTADGIGGPLTRLALKEGSVK